MRPLAFLSNIFRAHPKPVKQPAQAAPPPAASSKQTRFEVERWEDERREALAAYYPNG
jgi:hypothetical protein